MGSSDLGTGLVPEAGEWRGHRGLLPVLVGALPTLGAAGDGGQRLFDRPDDDDPTRVPRRRVVSTAGPRTTIATALVIARPVSNEPVEVSRV